MRTQQGPRHLLSRAAAAATLCLIAASCAGDDDDASEDTTSADTTAEGTAAEGTAAEDTAAEGGDDTVPATAGPSDEPAQGGRLVIGTSDEPTLGFYPSTSAVAGGGNTIAMAIFDTLSAVDADGNFVPYLAESIEPNDDNTVWTIMLREGIEFADGTPLDGAALKDNFDRMDAAGRPIEAGFTTALVGDMAVEVTFPGPYGAFVAAVSSPYAWIASPTAMAEMTEEEFDENPVGTGPYVIKEWVRDDHLTVERNPNYWRADEGLPHLDEIEFRPIIEDDVRVAALEAGDVDAIMVGTGELAGLRERADEFTVAETNQGVEAVVYNNSLPLFQDVRVRTGLSQAIDVEALIASAWDGVGVLASGPMPGDNPFASEVDYPRYDPEAAQAMLAEYTAETGTEVAFTLSYGEGVVAAEIAQLLQQYWQDAGAQVTLGAPIPAGDFPGVMATHEYEVSLYGVPGFIDPDVWLNVEFRSDSFLNIGAIDSAEVDAALAISHGSTDFDERKAAYADMQQVLAEEVQWYFLRDAVLAVAARPGVEGLNEFPMLDGSTGITKQGQFFTPFAVEALWLSQ